MPGSKWNERYATGDLPWDTGEPNRYLVDFVRSRGVAPGRALDIGCGTGTNAVWLDRQGFDVLGIDISNIAIDTARSRAAENNAECRFETLDFLADPVPAGPFNLVVDLGVFHVFNEHSQRARFADRVADVLDPNGRWLSLIGSTEGPERDHGPPRRSLREVVDAVEPALEIVEVHSVTIHADIPSPAAAWFCLSRPRRVAAQPSTAPA